MKLSIVSTLYNSSAYLSEFHARATATASTVAGDDYEIVLVNDGSPDDSLEKAIALSSQDPHVVVVDLSRNFGHHPAMMTGLAYACGDQVFLIDSDLEEEPEWLVRFEEVMGREEADAVYGVQGRRKGGAFERWSGELYYRALDRLTELDHPRNIVTARLMSRRYVDALLLHREREMVISGLWVLTGYVQVGVEVTKHSHSHSTYNVSKKLSYAVSALTSFSAAPLKFIFYLGTAVFVGALLAVAGLLSYRFVLARPTDGWTSVMVSVWLLGGLIIALIGVVGIYITKIYSEVKQRPSTIVRSVYERGQSRD